MVKVSVIVPVYNGEQFIEKCIDSLLNQTLDEIEVVVVDDGSTDSSPEILTRYAENYSKIRYFRKENGGVSDARNYGLTYAEGEYIGYVDSDDFVDSDMYEVMYNKAKEGCCDIVECNLHHTFADYEDTEIIKHYYNLNELLCYGRFVVWNKIYLRSWLLSTRVQFPSGGIVCEDIAFIAMITPYITAYGYVDIVPVHYVQRRESLNNKSTKNTLQVFGVLRDIVYFYRENGFYDQYEKELEYLYARILLCSSFMRLCLIPEKDLRKTALKNVLCELTEAFPNWKKNPILRKETGNRGLFMRSINRVTYRIFSAFFPLFLKANRNFSSRWN